MSTDPKPRLKGPSIRVFLALLPYAERAEALADLSSEYAERADRDGWWRARFWLWRQTVGSLPSLFRRGWWRGWTGFEPRANTMHSGGPVFESWIVDLRYSLRRLASRRVYAMLAIFTLALGAGGAAAIFSVARTMLLEPLPVTREDDIGVFWFQQSWTEEEFLHFRPNFSGFQRVAAYRPQDATLELPGQPLRQMAGISTSAELFEVLGARPFMGRTFQPGEDLPGPEAFVVISYGLWEELGSDQHIIGRPLRLAGVNRTVVGVMPKHFWFPRPDVRVWMARQLSPERRSGQYTLIGRVDPGRDVRAMHDRLSAFAVALGQRFTYPPDWDKTKAPAMTPLREFLLGNVRPSVIATVAAMVLMLVIACVNVAGLMLGQVSRRAGELAVRMSLGAGGWRLVQQMAIEALVIGVVAGTAGALLAAAGFQVLVRALPLGPLAANATLDWTLFAMAIATAVLAAGIVAIVPSIAFWRSDLRGTLATSRTGGIAGRGGRLEGSLLVVQIALAVVLAAGAALLIRSVNNLRRVDSGLRAEGVAVVDATMPAQADGATRKRAIVDVLPALQTLPGVRLAAATQKLPLRGPGDNWGIRIEGRAEQPATTTAFRVVTQRYFDALGATIVRGRGFQPDDRAGTEPVIVINEALAAKHFTGEDPIGQRILTELDNRFARVIGIVENIAEAALTDAPVPARYLLLDQQEYIWQQATFVLRTATPADVSAALQAARATLQRDAPQLAVAQTNSLEFVFDRAVGPAGQVVTLLTILAVVALVLGAIGVYGMTSHFVARRTRDYGVYLALGLTPGKVLSQVIRRSVTLVAAGAAIGLIAAVALTGLLSSLLYGVGAADPVSLAVAVATLIATGILAAAVPAWRASRTDPVVVLRQQ